MSPPGHKTLLLLGLFIGWEALMLIHGSTPIRYSLLASLVVGSLFLTECNSDDPDTTAVTPPVAKLPKNVILITIGRHIDNGIVTVPLGNGDAIPFLVVFPDAVRVQTGTCGGLLDKGLLIGGRDFFGP